MSDDLLFDFTLTFSDLEMACQAPVLADLVSAVVCVYDMPHAFYNGFPFLSTQQVLTRG